MKPPAWGLAQGKTAAFVIPAWVTLREQTLVISRERRSGIIKRCGQRQIAQGMKAWVLVQ
jgi:hypothetical protein